MRWVFCQDCHIDGCCENQDRGNKCEVYAKKITEKCEKLEKQLKIAVDILEIISTHTIIPDEDTVEQVGMVYNWSSEALNQIEELDK